MIKIVDIKDYNPTSTSIPIPTSTSHYEIQLIDILELDNLIYICIVSTNNHIIICKLNNNQPDPTFNYFKQIDIDTSQLKWRFQNQEWDLTDNGQTKPLDYIQPFKLEGLKLVVVNRDGDMYLANVIGSTYGILFMNFV